MLGDLSLNKDVMLLSKEITSVDSSQVVNIGTTNAQTVNIGSATTAVVIGVSLRVFPSPLLYLPISLSLSTSSSSSTSSFLLV